MKKILIIEDNMDVRENLEEILELADYEVTTAENGKIGVEKAEADPPDLILCDVMMPVLDGFGVLRILGRKQETADVPFIFLTAKAEKTDFRKGMNLGADDYLTKPFNDVELLDAIEMRLKKSEKIKQSFDKTGAGLSQFFQEVKAFEAFKELSEEKEERSYRKKDILFEEEDTPRQVYFIVEGKVKLYKTNETGKELITEVLGKGDFLGYLPMIQGTKYTESAAAMEKVVLRVIPKKDFMDLLYNNSNVAAQLIKMLANNVSEKETQLLHLAYNSVRKRVAEALLHLHKVEANNNQSSIKINREDLASMAGTAKETVIRTLSEFKEDNLIEIEGGRISIVNMEELRDLPY